MKSKKDEGAKRGFQNTGFHTVKTTIVRMHLNVYLSTLLASLAVIAADASADVFQHKDKQLSSAKAVVSQSSSTRRAVASVFEQVTLPDGRSLQDVCEPLMNELIACEISNCPNAECNDAESSK